MGFRLTGHCGHRFGSGEPVAAMAAPFPSRSFWPSTCTHPESGTCSIAVESRRSTTSSSSKPTPSNSCPPFPARYRVWDLLTLAEVDTTKDASCKPRSLTPSPSVSSKALGTRYFISFPSMETICAHSTSTLHGGWSDPAPRLASGDSLRASSDSEEDPWSTCGSPESDLPCLYARRPSLLAAALLSACVTGSTTGGQESTQTAQRRPHADARTVDYPITIQRARAITVRATRDTNPDSEPDPRQPDVQVTECTQETFDATRQTIEGQQEAFATGDFATARTFSSQSFQSYVSVEQFQEIIVGTYPFLIDSPELAFPECQRETDTVLMRVEVDGSPSVIMIYRLVLEGDGWFIDGASIAGTREDVDV